MHDDLDMDPSALPTRPPGVSPEVHSGICAAIQSRRLVEVEESDGHTRIGEPHDYGIMNGKPTLLFYQTAGYSRSARIPDWRNLPVTKIASVRPLDKTFSGGRPARSGRHRQWGVLFIRVGQPLGGLSQSTETFPRLARERRSGRTIVMVRLRFYDDPTTGQPHIYNHGVNETEGEDVLARPLEDRLGRAGSRVALGQTDSGRYLRVIYVPDPEPGSVFVITAYEPGEKALKALRRRHRKKS